MSVVPQRADLMAGRPRVRQHTAVPAGKLGKQAFRASRRGRGRPSTSANVAGPKAKVRLCAESEAMIGPADAKSRENGRGFLCIGDGLRRRRAQVVSRTFAHSWLFRAP